MVPAPFCFLQSSSLTPYLSSPHSSSASWALITGATDGIGLGFAQELSSRGFNILLHGRNASKLERVRSELQATFPTTEYKLLTADASSFSPSDISALANSISSLPLTVLINNVGGTGCLSQPFKPFTTHTPTEISALLSLNVTFTMALTLALLPALQAQPRSLVMNMGSQAHLGIPFLPVYSATKAALHAWTRSLATEQAAAQTGVDVMEILIGSVQSQANQTERETWLVPSSRMMARASLERVGLGNGARVQGYWPHWVQQTAYQLVPAGVLDWFAVRSLRELAEGRKKTW